MIKLKKLTVTEDQEFKKLCEKWNSNVENNNIKNNILDIDSFLGEEISTRVEIDENKKFNNKFELGKYLYEKLNAVPMDSKIWHFIVIVYHKQLLRKDRKIGEIDRFYIDDRKSFYPFTHLLKPVFDLYRSQRRYITRIKFLLLTPVNENGSLFLEIVKRQDIMKNINFIEVSEKFFYDKRKNKPKRGAQAGVLRLIDLFKQYERTYDLYSMPADKIMSVLMSKHEEFNKFR